MGSLRRAVHGLCASILACLPVVLWDANSLEELSIPLRTGFGVSAFAGAIIILLSTVATSLLLSACAPSWKRWTQRRRANPPQTDAALLWLSLGAVCLGGAGYGAMWLGQRLTKAGEATLLTVPVAVAAVAGGWLLLRVTAERRLARWLEASRYASTGLWLAALLFASWHLLVLVWSWSILQQLELRPLLCWGVVMAAAAVGWLLPVRPLKRAPWAALMSLRVAAAIVAVMGLASIVRAVMIELPTWLALALELRPTATTVLLKRWSRRSGFARNKPTITYPDRSASCFPEHPPPQLASLHTTPSEADIVFITVDALRMDHIGLSGYPRDTTPNIDRHAATAALFDNGYSLSGTTRQTFRGLFTGVYGSLVHEVRARNSNWGFGFTNAQVTLAEMLRHNGYATVAYSTQWSIFSLPDGALDGFSQVDESAGDVRSEVGHSTDYLVGQVIERLSQPRQGNRFVWTHLMTPHHPYHGGSSPIDFGDQDIDRYDAAIHYFDREFGRLLDFVRAPERRKHTWLVMTADHGEGWYEHGIQGHGPHLYEEFARVPIMIWGPGVTPGHHTEPLSQMHLVPTLLEIGGVTPPAALCGRSLLPLLRAGPGTKEQVPKEPIYLEVIPDFGRSNFRAVLIDDGVKTIVHPNTGIREMYDLKVDAAERHNLAEQNPELLQRQLDKMRAWQLRHGMQPTSYGL